MQTVRVLEAESRLVLQGIIGMGTKKDKSSIEQVQSTGFHHIMACSHLAGILKLTNRLYL
jgi:hypothetical protein